jgi:capsular polysaccharide biosynthesis protein
MKKWLYVQMERLIRLVSANGTRSYSFAGLHFLVARDVKRIFPECIHDQGESETLQVPALEVGKTAFLLEGADFNAQRLLHAYEVPLEAPFMARFQATEQRQLFAASGSLLVRDKKLGTYLVSPESKSSRRVPTAFRRKSPVSVASYTAISSWKSCTFGDFGLLMLPKLARIAGAHSNSPVMLPSYSYVIQYLKLLGLELLPAELNFRHLIPIRDFAEVVFGPGVEEGFVCLHSDVDKIREKVVARRPKLPARRLYLRRTSRRRILNEEDLTPFLERHGIEVIPDDHPDVLEQADLLREADLVIAPHGALLANLVYCKPGTVVVELLPGAFPVICYRSLSQSLGFHYHAIYCTKLTRFSDDAVAENFHVDRERLQAAIETILHGCGMANDGKG